VKSGQVGSCFCPAATRRSSNGMLFMQKNISVLFTVILSQAVGIFARLKIQSNMAVVDSFRERKFILGKFPGSKVLP